MKKNYSILVVFTIAFCIESNGQASSPPSNLLPTITSPSPEVAAFARFGNYEVNLFNGTPNISIPLYEISVGEMSVPININYNASGIRVNDIPTNIGSGWSLNAGGAITRKVMGGMEDEYSVSTSGPVSGSFGYLNGGTVKNLVQGSFAELDYFREITDRHRIDAEPDIFSYNLPGKSGKFIFSQEDNLKPLFIPFEPLKASYVYATGALAMTDESGINYQFNDKESSTYSLQSSITSSWLLSNMTSSNGQDVINFNYSGPSYFTQTLPNDNFTVIDGVVPSSCTSNGYPYTPYTAQLPQPPYSLYNYNGISQKNLETIIFKNGKIVFQLAPEARTDFGLTGLKNRMQKILIYNLTGGTYNLIKEIDFYHNYSSNNNSTASMRLKLDKLIIKDGNGINIQEYNFEYNNQTGNYSLPDQNAKAIDYWGYYNGKFSSTLVPRTDISYTPNVNGTAQTISVGAPAFGTRDPDPAFMQAGILNKITYPTGGYSVFTYETNKYGTNPPVSVFYAGGLRIKKIESYDGVSPNPVTKTYAYGENESGYGVKNFVLENYFFKTSSNRRYWYLPDGINYNECSSEQIRTFLANPTTDIEPWDAAPVAYPYVTEYIGDGTTNTGKTVYQFNNQTDGLTTTQFYGGSPFVLSNHYHRGQVLFKSVYKKNADNTYTIVAQTENHYGAFPDVQKNNSALSVTHILYSDGPTRFGLTVEEQLPPASAGFFDWNGTMEYVAFKYAIQSGDKRLTQTIERTYDQNTSLKVLATTTDYSYENFNHMQPTKIITTNSKGEVIINYLKYAHEFAQPGNVYQLMVDKNIINKVIESRKTNNTAQVSLTKNNFYNWGNNNLLPQSVQIQVGTNPIETRALFNQYDLRGNIQEQQKTDDVKETYIWGYNKQYPVARVVGADYATVSSLVNQSVLDNPLSTEIQIRNELNNIRTGLAATKALVTTYTYKPLIGISSQTDPNGRTTYYEYDAFNRLVHIRDQDNNIIKKICYNYAGQPENCCLNTAPDWQYISALQCVLNIYNQNTGYQSQDQKDMNPCSPTYNTIQPVYTYNTTACPLPPCDVNNCTGESKKCVNGVCETGALIIEGYQQFGSLCVRFYHYEWSDASWSQQYAITVNSSFCGF
jgi:YD repeat-containing protein